jgi:hypothetical protein
MDRKKIYEWIDRYSIPLVLSTVAAVLVANLSQLLFHNLIISAFLATWADNIIFYGMMAYKEIKSRERYSFADYFKVLRNLIMEFGPAEILDSFVIRPFLLSVFPLFVPNYSLAILLASVAAEITYFIPVIIFYEIRKKIFKNQ